MRRHDVRQARLLARRPRSTASTPRCRSARTCRPSATNPYGWTKVMIEQILRDVAAADPTWRIALLRYFNPVGAHPSGTIGEDPQGIPNNLCRSSPRSRSAGARSCSVFGDDYPTPDGTGAARLHPRRGPRRRPRRRADRLATDRRAGQHVEPGHRPRHQRAGDARTPSSRAVGRDLPYEIVGRRPGDIAASYADPSRAQAELGWTRDPHDRRHVRRLVALAAAEPGRLPRRLSAAQRTRSGRPTTMSVMLARDCVRGAR